MKRIDFITIGIVARNEERSIGEALSSLLKAVDFCLKRRELKVDIFVVINGTSDNTEAVVRNVLSKVKGDFISFRIYNTPVASKTKALNHIRNNAMTDHIIFMDADILLKENCIFNLIEGYERAGCKIVSAIGMPRKTFYFNPIKAKLAIKMIEYATREGPRVDGAMYLI